MRRGRTLCFWRIAMVVSYFEIYSGAWGKGRELEFPNDDGMLGDA